MTSALEVARGMASAMPIPQSQDEDTQQLRHSLSWLIKLRWLALAGLAASLIAAHFVEWTPDHLRPAVTAAGLAGLNVALWWWHSRTGQTATSPTLRRSLFLQLVLDLIALSLILSWTGGILNPFVLFAIFPVCLAAILLPGWMAAICAMLAFLLVGGLVGCRLASTATPPLLDHVHGEAHYLEHPTYLFALTVAIAMTLFGAVYFVHAVVRNQRHSEERRRQHERIAHSRERLARIGMIAAGVAHSVRNPLHGVFNCLDLVRTSDDPAETEEALELLGEGLSRIEQVTTRLLSFTRDRPLALEPGELDPVISETLRLLEVRMHNRGIRIEATIDKVPRIRLDPLRLQEALFNILDNAIAAVTDRPDPRIILRVQAIENPFDGVEIYVEDTGPGIAPNDLGRIFDPFFSTKPVGEGTGLGLAIAKEVIDAHGGEILFQSSLNHGTIVRVVLPLHLDGDSA